MDKFQLDQGQKFLGGAALVTGSVPFAFYEGRESGLKALLGGLGFAGGWGLIISSDVEGLQNADKDDKKHYNGHILTLTGDALVLASGLLMGGLVYKKGSVIEAHENFLFWIGQVAFGLGWIFQAVGRSMAQWDESKKTESAAMTVLNVTGAALITYGVMTMPFIVQVRKSLQRLRATRAAALDIPTGDDGDEKVAIEASDLDQIKHPARMFRKHRAAAGFQGMGFMALMLAPTLVC